MTPDYLRAVSFSTPDHIPMIFHINDACWRHYPQERLFGLMEGHKLLFPSFARPAGEYTPDYCPNARKDHTYTDDFGCLWATSVDGIVGAIISNPIADWNKLDDYIPPDPDFSMGVGPVNWEEETVRIQREKNENGFAKAGLRHGHSFLQLCYLRGYENLLIDMAEGDGRIWKLIGIVEDFNLHIVSKYVDMGVDVMLYPEDLGMQHGPMLSPRLFRKYIKPSFERLMKPAAAEGIAVHMHSDGDIRQLADDLTDCGVNILNLQDLVNGIDWIAAKYRGRLCVDLDIDRQKVTPYGTPGQIDALIKEEVEKIAVREGGLIMTYGLYPGVPLENVGALMDAMEKYAFYYS